MNKKGEERETLRNLEVGGVASFPLSKLRLIRVSCSEFGLQYNRKYVTWTSRETGKIYAKRES